MDIETDCRKPMKTSRHKRQILIKYFFVCFGFLLNVTGYLSLLGLQSSINIADGVGAASVKATYLVAALFGVIVTPVMLTHMEPKTCILFCEATYLFYILMNYYPAASSLIIAGAIVGIGEATLLPAIMLFSVHYARCYARYGSKPLSSYMKSFLGVFYAVVQGGIMCGSLLNYGILAGGKSFVTQSSNLSLTSSSKVHRDLSICGKNDCQLPNVTNLNIENYVPTSQTLLYILIDVMAGLVSLAMCIHFFIIKNIDHSLEGNEEANDDDDVCTKLEDSASETNEDSTKKKSIVRVVYLTIKATLLHLINPKQLLLTPFAIYIGFLLSFGFIELTRAYGSCMVGVEKIGLLSALSAGVAVIVSSLSYKISNRFGTWTTISIGFCLDIGNYMICLFWIPTESSLWVLYIIFGILGMIEGIWLPLITEIYEAYFPQNVEIAFAVYNMYMLVGVAWQTGWSTSLCVYDKLYFQIALLCFSLACYGASRFIYYRKDPKNTEHILVQLK